MNRCGACIQRSRSVLGIVVQEWAAASQWVLHVGQTRRRPIPFVVATANGERDAVPRGNHHAGRPYLNIHRYHFTWRDELGALMTVERPPRQRPIGVFLAVRQAKPPLSRRGMRIERALEDDFLSLWVDDLEYSKKVGVFRG